MAHVFANNLMSDFADRRNAFPRRRKVRRELLEVLAIIQDGVRRGISHRAQILKIFADGLLHGNSLTPDLLIIE